MAERPKVVLTDYEFDTLERESRVIEEAGGKFVPAQCKNEDEIIEVAHDAVGLIVQYATITAKTMDACPNLKVISRYGVGVDSVDLEAATERGIYVANVLEYCEDEVSDHALALLMACARKTVFANHLTKTKKWDYKLSKPIRRSSATVVGLVGLGQIPRRLAAKLKAIGFQLISFDPYVSADEMAEQGVEKVELDELASRADYVSVHAPLTRETKGLIGSSEFDLMKSSAFLINTARGPVVDEAALIDALQKGQIAGAALDVVEQEPINRDNPLLQMDNVIINPHMAWYSEESQAQLQTKVAENVASVLKGGVPKYLVNKEVLESNK